LKCEIDLSIRIKSLLQEYVILYFKNMFATWCDGIRKRCEHVRRKF